jgi:hypothetical protein
MSVTMLAILVVMKPAIFALLAFTIPAIQASSIDKESLLAKYRDKFVVVTEDGLATGLCAGRGEAGNPAIRISSPGDVQVTDTLRCGAEAVHRGEILKVTHVSFHFGYLLLYVATVSPHSIIRGVGAFAHESLERGTAGIEIRAGKDGKDLDEADALAAHWFKPFDTPDAAKLGNTASGVFVNQVKAGMSFAEVEHALGVPQIRVELGPKVLYKYKDMTIEFHDGKVADVR